MRSQSSNRTRRSIKCIKLWKIQTIRRRQRREVLHEVRFGWSSPLDHGIGAIEPRNRQMRKLNKAQQRADGSDYFGETTKKKVQICNCFAQWKDRDERFHPQEGLHFCDPGPFWDVRWTVQKLPGLRKSQWTRESTESIWRSTRWVEKEVGAHLKESATSVKSNSIVREIAKQTSTTTTAENAKTQNRESSATTVEVSGTLQKNVQRR